MLITLGIIGVVAALTMPSLIGHYRKQEVETRLKKAYNTISNAIRLSEIDNGPMKDWPQNAELNIDEFWNVYLYPYLNGARICMNMYKCGYKSYDNKKWAGTADWGLHTDDSRVLFQLSDGTVIFFPRNTGSKNEEGEYIPNYVNVLFIDINGNKLPNEAGRDVFYFVRDYQNSRIYAPKGSCAASRIYCTYEIMSNSWQIPEDYPIKL